MFSIILLLIIIFLAYRIAPREHKEDQHIHGAGQVGLLAAIALFGVDYFTSYFYATGEMMSALHPYGLQHWAYVAVIIISIANAAFGFLYMYSLGVCNEGGGSYTASMRYLTPGLSLVVAVVLIQDYIFTIVVSTLSGVGQALSIVQKTSITWGWQLLIGAILVTLNWFLTIRGRGESGQVAFTMLGIFVGLTITMAVGLWIADKSSIPPVAATGTLQSASLGQALYHMLTASMKGLVALTGLEAMSNGIQFVVDEDISLVKWGKKHLPKLNTIWHFYSGKAGIGRVVQTSFLFYGGLTTLLLTGFAIRFNVFDGTLGRTLVANLSFIGFVQSHIPGGQVLFWAYQILAVILLTMASMTAFQDLQATEWRDVAIGEIPEIIVYRDRRGTFTRSVTISFGITLIIMFLVRADISAAIPYYGVGVFMPIMVMGFAMRKHILKHSTGNRRKWGSLGAGFAGVLSGIVFIGQIAGKWQEGGWVVLISFSILVLAANTLLISPLGARYPEQIHRIVVQKARVQGTMASIVEWQSLRMQQYRYVILKGLIHFFGLFGIHRPTPLEEPMNPGLYDDAVRSHDPNAPSYLTRLLQPIPTVPHLGGAPNITEAPDHDE